jgi:hypothetical protein
MFVYIRRIPLMEKAVLSWRKDCVCRWRGAKS